jgi:hypothetical protein
MNSQVPLALELAVGLVFLLSVCTKAARPAQFFDALAEYGIEHALAAVPVGIALIVLEAMVAFTHLSGWMLHLGMAIALCLLGIFAAAVCFALASGRTVACLCFGPRSGETASAGTLTRVLLLLASEVLIAIVWFKSNGSAWELPHELDAEQTLLSVGATAAMLLAGMWLVEVPAVVPRLVTHLAWFGKSVHS